MKKFFKKIFSNKKIMTIMTILILIIIGIIIVFVTYSKNKNFREWMDKNIFQKEKMQNNLPSVEIDEINTSNIFAFNKYIGILNKNNLTIYDSIGNKANELTVEVTTPVTSSESRYLAIGEEKGQKLYLIADKEIQWEKDVEGNISQIVVNRNGYVAVSIVDTNYKTVIAVYNSKGDLLFKRFLATTRVIATSLSNDNKYLAFAQIDTSGTMPQSKINIISIDKASSGSEDAEEETYDAGTNSLIVNIQYQDKNKLLCMYTNKITKIVDKKEETVNEFSDKKIAFSSVELENSSLTIEEKSSGIFSSESDVKIKNSDSGQENIYTSDSIIKEIYTADNSIALNYGSEINFINSNGWLLKNYKAEQEITGITLSNSIAGIIYRDKVEIISL